MICEDLTTLRALQDRHILIICKCKSALKTDIDCVFISHQRQMKFLVKNNISSLLTPRQPFASSSLSSSSSLLYATTENKKNERTRKGDEETQQVRRQEPPHDSYATSTSTPQYVYQTSVPVSITRLAEYSIEISTLFPFFMPDIIPQLLAPTSSSCTRNIGVGGTAMPLGMKSLNYLDMS
jgi:hypothetical protein